MSRIFSVRINLDEIASFLLRWRSPDSRADWLDGFLTGCSGVDIDGTEPFTQANKLGLVYHGQAAAFQSKQSETAHKRWHPTAMPRHESGIPTAMPRHESGIPTAMPQGMPQGMPEACLSNNRVIEESSNPINEQTKNQKTGRFAPPCVEEVRDYCSEKGYRVDPEAFVAFYGSNGWKVGKNTMKNWHMALVTWEKRLPPVKPDDSGCSFQEVIPTLAEARKLIGLDQ